MATHKSAAKRHRQSLRKREYNRLVKSAVRTAIKQVREAIKTGNNSEALTALLKAEGAIASAAKKGAYHRSNAARKISRIAKATATLKKA